MPESDLEKAQERIQTICEKIRLEVLDPAKEQAHEIVEKAKRDAEHIRGEAHQEAKKIVSDVQQKLEEEKRIYASALEAASRQAVEMLKQKVEKSFFNPAIENWIRSGMGEEKETAKLIEVIIQAVEKEGITANINIQIPKTFSAEKILSHMARDIAVKLKSGAVIVGDMDAGIRVNLSNRHLTLDISDEALREILGSYLRQDFRKTFFHK
jgi:V/A-type H+-transporting ATPase subunit E